MTSLNLKQFVITAFIHSKQFILSKTKETHGGLNLKITRRRWKNKNKKKKWDFVINEVIRNKQNKLK